MLYREKIKRIDELLDDLENAELNEMKAGYKTLNGLFSGPQADLEYDTSAKKLEDIRLNAINELSKLTNIDEDIINVLLEGNRDKLRSVDILTAQIKMQDYLNISSDVSEKVNNYFKRESLENYKVAMIAKLSNHPDDYYLYQVMAYNENDDSYTVWHTFNTSTNSINNGDYGLTFHDALEVVKERIRDIERSQTKTMIIDNADLLEFFIENMKVNHLTLDAIDYMQKDDATEFMLKKIKDEMQMDREFGKTVIDFFENIDYSKEDLQNVFNEYSLKQNEQEQADDMGPEI